MSILVSDDTTPRTRQPQSTASAASDWQTAWKRLRYPVLLFFVSRIVLAVVAWRSTEILGDPHIRGNASVLPGSEVPHSLWPWIGPWFRFDARWYVDVAVHGYHWGTRGTANTNFMPGYPLLIRSVHLLTGLSPWIAALVIANIACMIALILIWVWATERVGETVASRTLVLVATFPCAFFLSAPYAEPVFLCLAVSAFLLAERQHWWLATVAAGISTVTRPVGVAVVVGLIAFALSHRRVSDALRACMGFLPLALFSAYLAIQFGHPLGFLTYHSDGWVAPSGSFLHALGSQFHTHLSPFDRIDAFLAAIFLLSGAAAWRRLGAGYGVYVLAGVALPLVHGLVSMERYVVVLFPAMGTWALWRSNSVQAGIFALCVFGLVFSSMLFAAGYSVF